MEYCGKNNLKRVKFAYSISDLSYSDIAVEPINYLKTKDLFWEFIEERGNSATTVCELDVSSGLEKKDYNGKTYWYGRTKRNFKGYWEAAGVMNMDTFISYAVELPPVFSDEQFHWKENRKYNSLEATISDGVFEFRCVYRKGTEDVMIDVRYVKCDNKHRNKVTISTIEVYNASNKEIVNAICEWKKEFISEMNVRVD